MRVVSTAEHHASRFEWALRILKSALFLFGVTVSVKLAESFLIYSAQAGGLAGLGDYRQKYEAARAGQLLTFAAFIGLQVIGGFVLRSLTLARRSPSAWSLARFVGVHLLLTLLAIAAAGIGAILLR